MSFQTNRGTVLVPNPPQQVIVQRCDLDRGIFVTPMCDVARRDFDKTVGGVTDSTSGGRLLQLVQTLLPRRSFGNRLAMQEAKGLS
jgi:hypothetical protein